MIRLAHNNIFLCDLEYLGAEITFMEKGTRHGRRLVKVSMRGGGTYDILVKACPQGYRVTNVRNMLLSEFAGVVSRQYHPHADRSYIGFVLYRGMRVRMILYLRAVLFLLSAKWALSYYVYEMATEYAVMSFLALAMAIDSFFLMREVLKKTYQDYLKRQEKEWRE